jgi:acylphosphatase
MNLVTVHAFVSGKVQGVYYRDTVRRKALAQAISGWVRNLSDGRVEVMATGDPNVINEFTNWLWQGSPASKVSQVDWALVEVVEFPGFEVK